jgi:hypothetical protein
MPRPPLDLPYPFPHGQESEPESMRHYDASNGQRYHIDPRYGDVSKLGYFHFAREIEQGIQSKRMKMTNAEKVEDNKLRDSNRNKLKLQDQLKTITPSTENVYSRTDEEGNVVIPNEEPGRSSHFDAGCNCFR